MQKDAWQELSFVEQRMREQNEFIDKLKLEHQEEVDKLKKLVQEKESANNLLVSAGKSSALSVSPYVLFKDKVIAQTCT